MGASTKVLNAWQPQAIAVGSVVSLLVILAPLIVVERWQRAGGRAQFTIRSLFAVTFIVAVLVMFFGWAPGLFRHLEWWELPIVLFSFGCAIYLALSATWFALGFLRRPAPAKVEADGSPAQ